MPNFGFATISIIPSFEGISTKLRLGIATPLVRTSSKAAEDAGKEITQGLERTINPDLKKVGVAAGHDLSRGIESAPSPDLGAQGSQAGDSFTSKLGSSVKDKGKAALIAGGVAAGALLAAGVLQGLEQEASGDRLAAQLGGSDWAKGLGEVAGKLYLDGFGEGVADTGKIVRGVVQNGLLSEDASNSEIEALSGQVATFTDVMEQDLQPTIRAVATLLRTGMADSAEGALDLLTRGIQQGADLGEDLLDTLNEYPTLFRDLGLEGEKGLGLIIQGLKGGARNSDIVADALKEFGIRSKDASALSLDSFKKLGLNGEKMTAIFAKGGPEAAAGLQTVLDKLRGMTDPVARNAAAVGLFGTQAEDLGQALFELNPDTAVAAVGRVAGATDKLGEAYDNNAAKLETFKRRALQKVTDGLVALAGWVDKNQGTAMILAGIVGGVLTAATVAWAVSLFTAGGALAFLISPITLIVGGLALLALGVKYAYDHFGFFHTAVDTAWQILQDIFGWVSSNWPLLLAILTGPIGLAVKVIIDHFTGIKNGITAVKDFLTSIAGTLWDGLKSGLTGVTNFIIGVLEGLLGGIVAFVNGAIRAYNLVPFHDDIDTIDHPKLKRVGTDSKRIGTSRGDLGGALALGGTAYAGHTYRVNEKGWELFTPGQNGTVIPNHDLGMIPMAAGGDGLALDLSVAVDPSGGETAFLTWLLKALRIRPGARNQLAGAR